ncbi:MAG: orotidine-5'-phosphate decarboxylase [Congregibacter sp.]
MVAIDRPDADSALALARQLDPRSCRLKVGKELFTAAGPALVDALQQLGFQIFLDLKFHDIPNTVASALKSAAEIGVWMVNVHASGGRRMLEAAVNAMASVGAPPLLIGVTVLTSIDEEDYRELGFSRSLEDQVRCLAKLSQDCGLDGVVCSAREAAQLRATCGEDFALVTPGIRPAGSDADDQRRIVTPEQAMRDGASYLVIGRPITGATNPADALAAINVSLSS